MNYLAFMAGFLAATPFLISSLAANLQTIEQHQAARTEAICNINPNYCN